VEKEKLKIMFVVGEVSGDTHGAGLIRELKKLSPQTEFDFFGTTGKKMRAEGVETVFNADEFAIVGVPEVARALPMFWNVFQNLKREALQRKPDTVVLIDFPEFNLKFAKALKKQGVRVVFYISPQLWAWRKYRVRGIKKYVDLLLTILPFEKDWYAGQGIDHVKYVGNPLIGEVKTKSAKNEFCQKHTLNSGDPIITLLPGSRRKEMEKILPELLKTAGLMAEKNPRIQFVIALAETRKKKEFEKILEDVKQEGLKLPASLIKVQNETFEALNASDAAGVTSGTATLETAIIGTPLVVVYKTSRVNYSLLKPLIKVKYYSLVNLISQKLTAVELIQDEFTAERLSNELFKLLEPEKNKEKREELKQIKELLGTGGASKKAAGYILEFLGNGKDSTLSGSD
jgi:lipid-A-disaccharide synthase